MVLFVLLAVFSFSFADSDENNVAIGYQIGGNTLIGISYEIRMDDVIGIHFGGGYLGGGAGMRFHFNGDQHSPYVDVNFKDAGFGLMESIGVEIGGTFLCYEDGDAGFRGSFGLQKVISIDPEFKRKLLGSSDVPPLMIALQIGWAW